MIYIKRFNFCFVRVPKNASSSVMHYLYNNFCDVSEDIISHGITDYPNRVSFINCPKLEHSHIDVNFILSNLNVPTTATFTGIIRHPLERQLSLYMFRISMGGYINARKPSPEHFRSLLYRGELQDYRTWQTQHQHVFLDCKKAEHKEWWLYDNLDECLDYFSRKYSKKDMPPLLRLNHTPGDKKDLISIFYDDKNKQKAVRAFEEDIELYEAVKSQWILNKTPYRI